MHLTLLPQDREVLQAAPLCPAEDMSLKFGFFYLPCPNSLSFINITSPFMDAWLQ